MILVPYHGHLHPPLQTGDRCWYSKRRHTRQCRVSSYPSPLILLLTNRRPSFQGVVESSSIQESHSYSNEAQPATSSRHEESVDAFTGNLYLVDPLADGNAEVHHVGLFIYGEVQETSPDSSSFYEQPDRPHAASSCLYHASILNLEGEPKRNNFTPMDRFLHQSAGEEAALLMRQDSGNTSFDKGCTCPVPDEWSNDIQS